MEGKAVCDFVVASASCLGHVHCGRSFWVMCWFERVRILIVEEVTASESETAQPKIENTYFYS